VERAHAGWKPGSRVARLHTTHSYRSVLLLVLSTVVFIAAAPDAAGTQGLLTLIECATLMLALWTSGLGQGSRILLVPVAVGIPAFIATVAGGGDVLHGTIWLLDVALVGAIIAAIGLGVLDQREVNRQSVQGAICVYLLLGTFFTFVYGALAALDSGPFFAQGTDGNSATRLYFSLVTLATVGYGDFTAASNPGRMLSVSEALLGQLYLVTVVAVLVSQLGRTRS
jgi:hypothetical protein